MVTGDGPHGADGTRLVLVVHEQHVGGGRDDIQPVVVDLHDVGLVPHGRAGQGNLALTGLHGGADDIGVFLGGGVVLLGYAQTPLPGQHRRIDQVDLLRVHRLQQALEDGSLQRPGVVLGDLTLVADGDPQKLALGQMGEQLAHHGGYRHEGGQYGMDLGGDEGRVHRVTGRFAVQNRQHLLRGLDCHLTLGLFGGCPQMGGDHHPGMVHQPGVLRRLLSEYVQGHAAQLARIQPIQDGLLVHQFTPGHVYQAGSGLEQGHFLAADHAASAVGQRSVQGDEVGLGQQLLQGEQLDALAPGVVGRNEGVVPHQPHVKALGAVGHFRTDSAQAANAQGLITDFHTHELATLPLARLQGLVSGGDVSRQGQHQGHGVFRRRHGVAGGSVDHGDTGGGGCVQVDVVHADAGAGDHLQLLGRLDDLLGHLGLAAHHQPVIIADDRQQLRRLHSCFYVHIGLGLEQCHSLGSDGV